MSRPPKLEDITPTLNISDLPDFIEHLAVLGRDLAPAASTLTAEHYVELVAFVRLLLRMMVQTFGFQRSKGRFNYHRSGGEYQRWKAISIFCRTVG